MIIISKKIINLYQKRTVVLNLEKNTQGKATYYSRSGFTLRQLYNY